jgi:hypothetical protein
MGVTHSILLGHFTLKFPTSVHPISLWKPHFKKIQLNPPAYGFSLEEQHFGFLTSTTVPLFS